MARFWLVLSLSLFVASFSVAQTSTVSDPQALTLAEQSIAAMTAGSAVSDVTLSGSATWIAGSDTETGPATLTAKGTTESRVDLNLSGGELTEVRNWSDGYPQGAWAKNAGTLKAEAMHNCFTDAAWFFPPLSSLAASSSAGLVVSYIGQESWNGFAVQHVRTYQTSQANSTIQGLTTMDFYLDVTSHLPFAITFKEHPDNDLNTDIGFEIRFANYRSVNGMQIPFHIQRLINGELNLDLEVTSAVVNSGLADTQFTLQ